MTEEIINTGNTTSSALYNGYETNSTSTSLTLYTSTTTALTLYGGYNANLKYYSTSKALSVIPKYCGVVYEWINKKECDEKGFGYIGSTADEEKRIYKFKNGNADYAGIKINEARRKYGTGSDVWDYKVLMTFYADSDDELDRILLDWENFCIIFFDTVNHGYNSRPNKFWHHSEETKLKIGEANIGHAANTLPVNVVYVNGEKEHYPSQRACSTTLNINQGLVSYYSKPENSGKLYKGRFSIERTD